MKVILTTSEILAKFGLSSDTELIIEDSNSSMPDNDGWISNIGRSKDGHPDSLSISERIEVKLRNGTIGEGNPRNWNTWWNEVSDLSEYAIIAYRILKD